jgi:hypothetical protein
MLNEAKLSELFFIVTRDVTQFRTDPDCIQAVANTLNMISTAEKIEAVCLHEAGHFTESVKLGLMVGFTESDIGYHSPRVIEETDAFGKHGFHPNPGSIFTPFDALKTTWTLPILRQAARVAVAGGVYAHKLANWPIEKGTGGDWELYTNYYRIALPKLHAELGPLTASKLWEWAKCKVAEDLKSSELERHARSKAQDFTMKYYGSFLDYCDLDR